MRSQILPMLVNIGQHRTTWAPGTWKYVPKSGQGANKDGIRENGCTPLDISELVYVRSLCALAPTRNDEGPVLRGRHLAKQANVGCIPTDVCRTGCQFGRLQAICCRNESNVRRSRPGLVRRNIVASKPYLAEPIQMLAEHAQYVFGRRPGLVRYNPRFVEAS